MVEIKLEATVLAKLLIQTHCVTSISDVDVHFTAVCLSRADSETLS